jgi:hypothetical protein
MAGFSAIRATSEAIRTLLDERRPRTLSSLSQIGVKVVRSTDFQDGVIKNLDVGVSILLYRVAASPLRRNFPVRQLPSGARLRSPLLLDLHYLVSAWGQTGEQQHLVLGWASLTLHDNAVIPPAQINRHLLEVTSFSTPDPDLTQALQFQPDEAVELSPEPLGLVEFSQLWDGLRPALSLGYVARLVRLDPARELEDGPPVRERVFDLEPRVP